MGDAWPDPQELVLHRDPMLLLDRIVGELELGLIAEVDIRPGKSFHDPAMGGVPAWVGIEYMAQTIAAYSGMAKRAAGEEIELGMLVSCRRIELAVPVFVDGAVLSVSIDELAVSDTGMAAFACRITAQNNPEQVLAVGQLGVFQNFSNFKS